MAELGLSCLVLGRGSRSGSCDDGGVKRYGVRSSASGNANRRERHCFFVCQVDELTHKLGAARIDENEGSCSIGRLAMCSVRAVEAS